MCDRRWSQQHKASQNYLYKKRERETYIFYNFFFSSSRFFLVNWVLVRIKIKKKKICDCINTQALQTPKT